MRLRRALAGSAAAALVLAGCGGSDAPRKAPAPQTLTVATGGPGGIYAVWGAELARQISRRLEGYRAVAARTTGSVENLERIRDGRAQIALTLGDTALDAVEGREAFDRPVAIKALAQIYPSYVQVVTRADANIGTLADLKGRRVSIGSPDSGTQVVAHRVLDVAKVPRDAFKRRQLGVAESATALQRGQIDAFFWSGGAPTGAVTELSKHTPIALVGLLRYAPEMRRRWGGVYGGGKIPAGTYGITAPVGSVTIPNYVVVSQGMDAALAHDLTSLLFTSRRVSDRDRAQDVIAPIGLHPGAQAYYSGD
jgi:TRAP transporter TAXI family solute receptor